MRRSVFAVSVLTLGGLLLAPYGADAAPPVNVCARAFDEAQELRDHGKLRAARDKFVACAASECPSLLRAECTRGLDDLTKATPTVVFAAHDQSDADLVDVRVTIDGAPLLQRLDGRPVAVDPGAHVFRFSAAGRADVELKALLRTGELGRLLSVKFARAAAAAPPSPDAAPAPPSVPEVAPPEEARTKPSIVPGIVLVSVGGALLGAGLWYDLLTTDDVHALRESCAPRCAQDQVDDAKSGYVTAAILASAGAVSAGVGVVLLLTRSARASSAPKASVGLQGNRLVLSGKF